MDGSILCPTLRLIGLPRRFYFSAYGYRQPFSPKRCDLQSTRATHALVIAGVGLCGRMAYAVSRRTNEIGIRMALGAERGRIVAMVLREVLVLAVAGLALGLRHE